MFCQSGLPSFPESARACLGLPGAGGKGSTPRPEGHRLPAFVSSAPPRSEGEALLRRIFSRSECV
jgi:hypothetical protein